MNLLGIWKQNEYVLNYRGTNVTKTFYPPMKVKAGQIFKPALPPTYTRPFHHWNTKSSGSGQMYYSGKKDRTPLTLHTLYARYNNVWVLKSRVNDDKIEFTKYKDGSCYAEFTVYYTVGKGVHKDGFLVTEAFRKLVDNYQKSEYGLSKKEIKYFADVKDIFNSYYKNGKIFSYITVGSDEYYALLLHIMKAGEDSVKFWGDIFTRTAVVWTIISAAINAKKPSGSMSNQNAGAGSIDDFLKDNVTAEFRSSVKNAFAKDAKVAILNKDMIVYRYYGNGSKAKSFWVTPKKYANPSSSLALPSANSAKNMATYTIPKGTTILEGTVAPAFGQPGGGYQIYVPNPSVLK